MQEITAQMVKKSLYMCSEIAQQMEHGETCFRNDVFQLQKKKEKKIYELNSV